MATLLDRTTFLADLQARIGQHVDAVQTQFQPLALDALNRKPAPKEWSVLQCFDHLNLTHNYYMARISRALEAPAPADAAQDGYAPSFWGRIYMYFAFNPRNSFPTAPVITPSSDLDMVVLADYLTRQEALARLLGELDGVDLRRTRVPLEKGVSFNLGDCLKVLVYHDALHIDQAQRVLKVFA